MTVLDIKKPAVYNPEETIHDIHTIDNVFSAIVDTLIKYPNATKIFINFKNGIVSRQELENKLGFKIDLPYGKYKNSSTIRILAFRGYYRWVYFLNDEPVHFSRAGCMTDSPTHLGGFTDKEFESLKWDRYEKIYI